MSAICSICGSSMVFQDGEGTAFCANCELTALRAENERLKARGIEGMQYRIAELEAVLKVALPCLRALEDTQRAMGHDYICTAEVEQAEKALEVKHD